MRDYVSPSTTLRLVNPLLFPKVTNNLNTKYKNNLKLLQEFRI